MDASRALLQRPFISLHFGKQKYQDDGGTVRAWSLESKCIQLESSCSEDLTPACFLDEGKGSPTSLQMELSECCCCHEEYLRKSFDMPDEEFASFHYCLGTQND